MIQVVTENLSMALKKMYKCLPKKPLVSTIAYDSHLITELPGFTCPKICHDVTAC